MQAAEQNRMRQYRWTQDLSLPRQWSQHSELGDPPFTFSAMAKRLRRRTIVVIGVRRQVEDFFDSILSPEKKAEVAAVALDTVHQGFFSARIVWKVQKFRSRRKTHCNGSDRSSFSTQFLAQLFGGMKGSACLACYSLTCYFSSP
jgi:hypothetical protein